MDITAAVRVLGWRPTVARYRIGQRAAGRAAQISAPKGRPRGGGEDMESIIFPPGVWAGYRWRDRISQRRRVQYLADRLREKREAFEREKS